MSDTNPNQTRFDPLVAAAAEAETQAQAQAKKADKAVAARVLVDCEHGAVNDLVLLPAADAKAAQSVGYVDTHKDAVAYAKTLPQNQNFEG